jgi:hypothetical protein
MILDNPGLLAGKSEDRGVLLDPQERALSNAIQAAFNLD